MTEEVAVVPFHRLLPYDGADSEKQEMEISCIIILYEQNTPVRHE